MIISVYAQQNETLIAVIGCHQQGKPAPALPYMAEKLKPDYCVWVGDNVYADTETDPKHIQRQLEIMESKPGFKELRDQSKFLVTWDDHDFGLNNAGKDYRFREESKQIHRKFWQLENEIPENLDAFTMQKLNNSRMARKSSSSCSMGATTATSPEKMRMRLVKTNGSGWRHNSGRKRICVSSFSVTRCCLDYLCDGKRGLNSANRASGCMI